MYWLAIGTVIAIALWVIGVYNTIVRADNTCDESWSGIETELKRRYDLIPNLVETVKGYAAHEREALESVTQARNAAIAPHESPGSQARDESTLTSTLERLFALAESYPDLKANQNFLGLQTDLSNTEDRIQRARRFYNANVRELANRIEVFPSNLIAKIFDFGVREYFELEDLAAREPVLVSLTQS